MGRGKVEGVGDRCVKNNREGRELVHEEMRFHSVPTYCCDVNL